MSVVLVERRVAGVGELVINRADRKNSLTPLVAAQLVGGLEELIGDETIKAIIFRGAGGFLCAGLDLREMARLRKENGTDGGFGVNWRQFHSLMYSCPKPTVMCLEGGAIAGGSGLALSGDFLVCGPESYLHAAEVNFGMAAPMNVFWLTLKHGAAKALEFVIGGQKYSGHQLHARGLATRVAETNILRETREFAATLAKNDSNAMAVNKRMVWAVQQEDGSQFDKIMARIYAQNTGPIKGPPPPESRLKKSFL